MVFANNAYTRQEMIKFWVRAMRLRTLPLSLSGLILGGALAHSQSHFSWTIFTLSILSGVFLQILSNFANDYGDAQKGSDGKGRLGEKRMVASGLISPRQMLNACYIMIFCIIISAGLLFWFSFKQNWLAWGIFAILLLCSILAALFYTIGKNAYGY